MKNDIKIGNKYGRLTVISSSTKTNKSLDNYWVCQCECGNKKEVRASHLRNRKIQSCGCLNKELVYAKCKKYNKYDLSGEYGIGYTSNTNEPFYFDLEDYNKIKDICWYNSNGYIRTSSSNKTINIHRVILGIEDDRIIDHKNRNPLDNRKENLRICTKLENNSNISIPKNNKSGIIGVYFDKDTNKWCTRIQKNYKKFYLGSFINKEDAIKTRLEAEKKYFGEFAPQKHLFKKYNIE